MVIAGIASRTMKEAAACKVAKQQLNSGRVSAPAAGAVYFRMKYISQLAAITDPTNSTQQ